jgi:hypothetical protein
VDDEREPKYGSCFLFVLAGFLAFIGSNILDIFAPSHETGIPFAAVPFSNSAASFAYFILIFIVLFAGYQKRWALSGICFVLLIAFAGGLYLHHL